MESNLSNIEEVLVETLALTKFITSKFYFSKNVCQLLGFELRALCLLDKYFTFKPLLTFSSQFFIVLSTLRRLCRDGVVALLTESLLCKCKALSSNSNPPPERNTKRRFYVTPC
jgi:hypothetical protein